MENLPGCSTFPFTPEKQYGNRELIAVVLSSSTTQSLFSRMLDTKRRERVAKFLRRELTLSERDLAILAETALVLSLADDCAPVAIAQPEQGIAAAEKNKGLPEPVAESDKRRDDWRDDDELTRAQAASRLGITERYFRTQFEAGRIRGKRYSRKTIRYIWGEIREDWRKIATE